MHLCLYIASSAQSCITLSQMAMLAFPEHMYPCMHASVGCVAAIIAQCCNGKKKYLALLHLGVQQGADTNVNDVL